MPTLLHLPMRSVLLVSTLSSCAFAEVLDDFSAPARWEIVHSEGVDIRLAEHDDPADGDHHTALRVDVDFVTGGGYGGIRRELPLDLPPNFELAFSVRGDLPPNNLEFKLTDESGETVWWVNRRRFEFPNEWTRLASRRRHFEFAWGPSNEPFKRIRSLEIIIASAEGGNGTLYLDDLTFRPLPETKPYTGTPVLLASSTVGPEFAPQAAMDGKQDTRWTSAANDLQPTLTVDFGAQREFGGLIIDWSEAGLPQKYEIQFSDDGANWTTVRQVNAVGRRQYLSLPDAEARAVRLAIVPPAKNQSVGMREVEVLPLEASRDGNAFAAEIARRAPRGHYPRATAGEGTFWTLVGVPWDDDEALLSEDGALEVDKRSFSIEPFLWHDSQLLTWADASTTQSLAEECAPAPTVVRRYDHLDLSVTAFADGEVGDATLWAIYQVTNTTNEPVEGSLLLAMRPFQVNPPYQWLNTVGGVSHVGRVAFADSGRGVIVDDKQVTLGTKPDACGAAAFDEGDVTNFLSRKQLPPHVEVTDPQKAASAAMEYRFQLPPRTSRTWVVCVPFAENAESGQALLSSSEPNEMVKARLGANVRKWVKAISSFDLLLPDDQSDILNTIRSTLGYILINGDGKAIHPGSRSYERSWIRDGSLTATALLRFGLEQPAREFVDWYAPHQFESGKVPCVVDHRGPDPVPENDSHGQLIMAVMNVYRFTGDREFLQRHETHVKRAVAYIEKLRAERMTPEYADPHTTATHQEPDKPAVSLHAFYGLMPESISHEGYSAKPMHSYWDDFFTLKGLKDAAEMMRILNQQEVAERYQAQADEFAATLYASIELARATHGIDYIPGCVELGDFDATSTTIALWPCGELARLPQPALDRTFQRYWESFVERRDNPDFEWDAYTPYEVRTIGSLVLLGQKERALEAMQFFLGDLRPPAWNQWPEVIYRQPRAPRFLGDLPHTWCGSDFINSVRLMFLHERESDEALVLLAGVPKAWLSEEPIGFRDLPTYGGRLTCTIARANERSQELIAQLSGTCPVPRGGIHLNSPPGPVREAEVNDQPAAISASGTIVVRELPATIKIQRHASVPE